MYNIICYRLNVLCSFALSKFILENIFLECNRASRDKVVIMWNFDEQSSSSSHMAFVIIASERIAPAKSAYFQMEQYIAIYKDGNEIFLMKTIC